jgi:hypothetical protein
MVRVFDVEVDRGACVNDVSVAGVLRVSTWMEVDGVNATVDLGEMTAAAMERIALEHLMVAEFVRVWTGTSSA